MQNRSWFKTLNKLPLSVYSFTLEDYRPERITKASALTCHMQCSPIICETLWRAHCKPQWNSCPVHLLDSTVLQDSQQAAQAPWSETQHRKTSSWYRYGKVGYIASLFVSAKPVLIWDIRQILFCLQNRSHSARTLPSIVCSFMQLSDMRLPQ